MWSALQHPALLAALGMTRVPRAPRKALQCTAASVSRHLVQNWSKCSWRSHPHPAGRRGAVTPQNTAVCRGKDGAQFAGRGFEKVLVLFCFNGKGLQSASPLTALHPG